MTTPEDGGDSQRPTVGRSYLEREKLTRTYEGGGSGEEFDHEAHTVEDAYADHLVDHGKGAYPGRSTLTPPDPDGGRLLAAHPIDPGAPKKELFVDLDAYEDPATGTPRPSSPVERLRQDLDRLKGAGQDTGLKLLLDRARLDQRELGAWQAADDLRATTDKAHAALGGAIDRLYTVYESVIQALDATVQTAKGADRSLASDRRART
ncbi:hypothetical protein B0I32_102619 [Nonomuraea fuscirosea]|uniref:Uncharacterized protein n=1 Tax=Nonomuraea fuscirosea TaxID=1291556 RepID=A0A2T0N9S6_9ACTN|nr:hypothetical protein [Nonomuraea fuscirosea]PRX69561.1 hypothetical protein B0I32_102619 [Nonomuraea fuscirosea]